jgi:hypothetical protein
MSKRVKTISAADKAWKKLMALGKVDKLNEATIVTAFNDMCDDLLDSDFFGTEGQLDPRGDKRNTED